jgi:hypothetical protein
MERPFSTAFISLPAQQLQKIITGKESGKHGIPLSQKKNMLININRTFLN